MRKIRNAEPPGYEKTEIVGAVLHAMIASLTLRNVLETATNPTL